jgi:hypothetical protein
MLNGLLRWVCAATILLYGFAKLNGSQFTILDSELDKPMGQVSGFWLTWYYFGYSKVYGTFLALVQVLGAFLLTFRRSALLGACILAPVFANIVLIDLCYGVDSGAMLTALLLLCGLLILIAPRAKDLWQLFFGTSIDKSPSPLLRSLVGWCARVVLLGLACGFTYWVANFNNRAPTPIDGAWTVKAVEPASAARHLPSDLFFEYNRAHMAVFKYGVGSYETHHFEAGKNGSEVKMWEKWLSKGDEIFSGIYTRKGQDLQITGKWNMVGPVTLTLSRLPRTGL